MLDFEDKSCQNFLENCPMVQVRFNTICEVPICKVKIAFKFSINRRHFDFLAFRLGFIQID